jgi:hypothetical protein
MGRADSIDTTLTRQQAADIALAEFQRLRSLRQAARHQLRRLVDLIDQTEQLLREVGNV